MFQQICKFFSLLICLTNNSEEPFRKIVLLPNNTLVLFNSGRILYFKMSKQILLNLKILISTLVDHFAFLGFILINNRKIQHKNHVTLIVNTIKNQGKGEMYE